jgi:hypothetical protein
MIEQARLEDVGSGLAPVSPGWFVVNVAEAAWVRNEAFGGRCGFESTERDFVHLPPGTRHTFVGTGDGQCAIFMTGARRDGDSIVYPRSETALAHDAGVEAETPSPAEAYARYRHWALGRPDTWAGLPWSD